MKWNVCSSCLRNAYFGLEVVVLTGVMSLFCPRNPQGASPPPQPCWSESRTSPVLDTATVGGRLGEASVGRCLLFSWVCWAWGEHPDGTFSHPATAGISGGSGV